MKTNIYILLILLLSVSFVNAQDNTEKVVIKTNKTISLSEVQETVTVNAILNDINENEVLFLDASEVKEVIARGNSDIKIYLNRLRNVENISIIFPKLNKAIKA